MTEEQDSVGTFVTECFEMDASMKWKLGNKILYDTYLKWYYGMNGKDKKKIIYLASSFQSAYRYFSEISRFINKDAQNFVSHNSSRQKNWRGISPPFGGPGAHVAQPNDLSIIYNICRIS